MRKQYHFKKVDGDIYIWDVDKLIQASSSLPVSEVPISEITDFNSNYWYHNSNNLPSPKSLADHMKLTLECDLKYPIILSSDGSVMDGMHRLCKAYLEGSTTIKAKRFIVTPKHDYVNVDEDDLKY